MIRPMTAFFFGALLLACASTGSETSAEEAAEQRHSEGVVPAEFIAWLDDLDRRSRGR